MYSVKKYHIEIDSQQKSHHESRICGDVFLIKRIPEEKRTLVVLADGMGHGVKANMLATLTSTMALNFMQEYKTPERIAETILNTLPVCSDRKVSYSTFTLLDFSFTGEITITEFDNPVTQIIRGYKFIDPGWKTMTLPTDLIGQRTIRNCTIRPQLGDRIVLCSDGVVQSGMGTAHLPLGWGMENYKEFLLRQVKSQPGVSAYHLAGKVVTIAHKNDGYMAKDDISCCTIYFREPRKMMICTGPPYHFTNDPIMAEKLKNFKGAKIVSGATTSEIISREWKVPIEDGQKNDEHDLPPESIMEGVDLVTEGILTITRMEKLLREYKHSTVIPNDPAGKMFKLIHAHDEIYFLVGTRVNLAHQDPNMPVEIEIRRSVVKRLKKVLKDKFLKDVRVEYI